MPVPTTGQGHFDQMLTDFSISYMQSAANFVAPRIFPRLPVAQKSAHYYVFPRGYFLRDEVAPRPMGGVPRIVHHGMETETYNCEEEGLRALLDKNERINATPPYNPERSKVNMLAQQHLIHRDRKWTDAFMRPGVWATDLTGTATGSGANEFVQWDNDNEDVVEQIDEHRDNMARSTGITPNRLVLGRKVLRRLRGHAQIKDAIKYTQTASITLQILAGLFDVEQVISPLGVYNAAGGEIIDPATGRRIVNEDYRFIVGEEDALLTYASDAPGLDAPSGGYSITWTGLLGNGAFDSVVNRGPLDYGEWFDVLMAFDMKVTAPDLGVFFGQAVTA